jgi:hypothetical protein
MPVDVSGALRQALARSMAERARIERQIRGLRQALSAGAGVSLDGGRPTGRGPVQGVYDGACRRQHVQHSARG